MACFKSLLARRIVLWYILLGSVVILPLTFNVSLGCRFMNVVGFDDDQQQDSFESLGVFNAAVYDQQDQGGGGGGDFLGCVSYSQFWQEQTNDIGFRTARIASGFLLAFATLATLICLCLQCFSKHGKSHLWNVMRACYIGALVCQGLMYAIFASDLCKDSDDADDTISSSGGGGDAQRCAAGRNGIAGIFNFIILLGMVIATFNSFPPRNPVFQCWGSAEIEYDNDEYESDDEGGSTEEEDEVMRKFKAFGDGKDDDDDDDDDDDYESVSLFGSSRSRVSKKSRKSYQRSVKSRITVADETISDETVSVAEKGLMNVDEESTSISYKSAKSNSSKSYKSKASKRSKSIPGVEKYLVAEEQDSIGKGSVAVSSSKSRKSSQSITSQRSKKSTPVVVVDTVDSASVSSAVVVVDTVDSASVSSAKSARRKSKFLPAGVAKYLTKENKSIDNESVSSSRSNKSSKSKTVIPSDPIVFNSGSTVEMTNFMNQLVEMTTLSEGGRRVKTDEQDGQLEIVDEYPTVAGEEIKSTPSSDLVKIRTEYYDLGSRTTKEITHRDGSCTIVTTIVADNSPAIELIESTGSAGSIKSTNSSKYQVLESASSGTVSISQERKKSDEALAQGAFRLSIATNKRVTKKSEP